MMNVKTIYDWETGNIKTVECVSHSYAWSGTIPCTGIKRCIYCGKEKGEIMSDIYLMFNGTKVELPESVINKLKELDTETIDDDVTVLSNLIIKHDAEQINHYTEYKPFSKIINNNKVIFIKMPPGNNNWCFSIFDAIKEFINLKKETVWISYHTEYSKPGHLSLLFAKYI